MASILKVDQIKNTAGVSTVNADASGNISIDKNLTVDTNTFHVDATNNRVGIGTATPNEALTIEAPLSGDTGLAINYSGDNKAGITVNPITGQIKVGAHPDLTNGSGYYLSFNTAVSNTVYERMKIDSSGRVTMPAQPMFFAKGSNGVWYIPPTVAQWHSFIGGTTHGTSPYTIAVNWLDSGSGRGNRGSHFSTSTGLFTAPVAGFYQFHMSMYGFKAISNTGAMFFITSFINGSGISDFSIFGEQGPVNAYPDGISKSIIVYLSANDTFDFRFYQNIASAFNFYLPYTCFSGHLIG